MGKFYYFSWSAILFVNLLFLTALFAVNSGPKILLNPVSVKESAETKSNISLSADDEDSIPEREYHILLLGLDSRKGDNNPRCDAVHIFSFSPKFNYLLISSIPRGTFLSPETDSTYLANSCSRNGIEYTIGQIEKMSQIKIDAVVKIGFSETLGIFRTLKMPTTSTLQFLRSRQYAIGDNQRSHNQALFIKDMITTHFEEFYNMPQSIKSWLLNTVDTDLTYHQAEYLLQSFYQNGVYKNPDNILLETLPKQSPYVRDLHLPEVEYQPEDKDQSFWQYQQNLVDYQENLILRASNLLKSGKTESARKIIETPFSQKLWLQLENEAERQDLHYRLLEVYSRSIIEKSELNEVLNNYLQEMTAFQNGQYMAKAESLLSAYLPDLRADIESKYTVN